MRNNPLMKVLEKQNRNNFKFLVRMMLPYYSVNDLNLTDANENNVAHIYF